MKRILIGSLIVVAMLGACSEDDPFVPTPTLTGTITLPDSASVAEGNTANASPFNVVARRFQCVYGAALLSSIPVNARITGMRFRLDALTAPFAADTIAIFEVFLSTSTNPPGSLSATFADNRGNDEVLVRDAQLTIDPSDYPTGGSPNAWGKLIPFSTAFIYKGGDLLVEIGVTGLTIANRPTDNVFPSTDTQTGYGTGFSATMADLGLFQDLVLAQYEYTYQ